MKSKSKIILIIFTFHVLLLSSAFARVTCSTYNDKPNWCQGQIGCYYDKGDCGCKELRTIPPNCGSYCCATGFTSSGTTLTQTAGYFLYTCAANNVNQIAAAPSPSVACQANFTMDSWYALKIPGSTKWNYSYRCKVSDGGATPN